jgi:hypothetical protein
MNEEIKENFILFTKIILDESDITDLKTIIKEKTVKIIITKEFHVEQPILDQIFLKIK